jgi:phospholipid/cholesterol/gamma-HCH transport system permease protein
VTGPRANRQTAFERIIVELPPSHAMALAGGRFVSRGALLLAAMRWLVWISFSRRSVVTAGVAREMYALGIGALRLVASASVLVGLIAIFQVSYQLAPYSAETMSIKTIGWFAARELGPLVAALLVVARSASAIAGELGAMSASAELDALRAMDLDPVKYLVTPKLAALIVSLPALTIIADALIAVGGWLGAVLVLNVGTTYYLEQFRESLALRDLFVGLVKSVLFGVIIAVVPADEGLSVGRRVGAIGAATTRAVVFSMIGVLALDTLVNAVFYFIPRLLT